MKQKKWIARAALLGLFLGLMTQSSFAQPEGGLYVGIGPRFVLTGYEFQGESKVSFGAEVSYLVPLTNSAYYEGSGFNFVTGMVRNFNVQGFFFRPVINAYFNDKNGLMIKPEFGYLWSGNFIIDEGKSAGTTSAYYAEFRQYYQSYGIHIAYNLRFGHQHMFSFFAGTGFRYNNIVRKYSIEGYYSLQTPVNKSEKLTSVTPSLDVGFRFYIPGTNPGKTSEVK
jgi:hypothetical protein